MLPYCIMVMEDNSDRAFMTELYVNYHRLMYRTILQIVHDPWTTDDLMQATLVKLIDKVELLRKKDRDRQVNYIITACKNHARNYLRDRKRHPEFPLDDYLDTSDGLNDRNIIEARLMEADELQRFADIWPKLDEKSKHILESYYTLGRSTAELAEELGIKRESVKMALHRARANAYRLMQDETPAKR